MVSIRFAMTTNVASRKAALLWGVPGSGAAFGVDMGVDKAAGRGEGKAAGEGKARAGEAAAVGDMDELAGVKGSVMSSAGTVVLPM